MWQEHRCNKAQGNKKSKICIATHLNLRKISADRKKTEKKKQSRKQNKKWYKSQEVSLCIEETEESVKYMCNNKILEKEKIN